MKIKMVTFTVLNHARMELLNQANLTYTPKIIIIGSAIILINGMVKIQIFKQFEKVNKAY